MIRVVVLTLAFAAPCIATGWYVRGWWEATRHEPRHRAVRRYLPPEQPDHEGAHR